VLIEGMVDFVPSRRNCPGRRESPPTRRRASSGLPDTRTSYWCLGGSSRPQPFDTDWDANALPTLIARGRHLIDLALVPCGCRRASIGRASSSGLGLPDTLDWQTRWPHNGAARCSVGVRPYPACQHVVRVHHLVGEAARKLLALSHLTIPTGSGADKTSGLAGIRVWDFEQLNQDALTIRVGTPGLRSWHPHTTGAFPRPRVGRDGNAEGNDALAGGTQCSANTR